jgi:hypothetical protein
MRLILSGLTLFCSLNWDGKDEDKSYHNLCITVFYFLYSCILHLIIDYLRILVNAPFHAAAMITAFPWYQSVNLNI